MTKFLLALSAIIGLALAGSAYAAECHTVAEISAMAAENGVAVKVYSGSALAEFEHVVTVHGQSVPDGATRAMTIIHNGGTYYGFEVAGCLTGPFELQSVGA